MQHFWITDAIVIMDTDTITRSDVKRLKRLRESPSSERCVACSSGDRCRNSILRAHLSTFDCDEVHAALAPLKPRVMESSARAGVAWTRSAVALTRHLLSAPATHFSSISSRSKVNLELIRCRSDALLGAQVNPILTTPGRLGNSTPEWGLTV